MQLKLAEVLKQWRYGARLSVRAAAHDIGIGYSTLSRVENGEWPDGRTLAIILRWLLSEGEI